MCCQKYRKMYRQRLILLVSRKNYLKPQVFPFSGEVVHFASAVHFAGLLTADVNYAFVFISCLSKWSGEKYLRHQGLSCIMVVAIVIVAEIITNGFFICFPIRWSNACEAKLCAAQQGSSPAKEPEKLSSRSFWRRYHSRQPWGKFRSA